MFFFAESIAVAFEIVVSTKLLCADALNLRGYRFEAQGYINFPTVFAAFKLNAIHGGLRIDIGARSCFRCLLCFAWCR